MFWNVIPLYGKSNDMLRYNVHLLTNSLKYPTWVVVAPNPTSRSLFFFVFGEQFCQLPLSMGMMPRVNLKIEKGQNNIF